MSMDFMDREAEGRQIWASWQINGVEYPPWGPTFGLSKFTIMQAHG